MHLTTKLEIISELRKKIGRDRAANQLTQKEIFLLTGVHQSQISRFMAGDFNRLSHKLKTLCDFLKINCYEEKESVENNEVLMNSLQRAWDGSEKHALVLARLLDSVAITNSYISEK